MSPGIDVESVAALLDAERERLLPDTSGEVVGGNSTLEGSREGCFGIAVRQVDGALARTEQSDVVFPIQSVVKPWLYAVALADRGEEVHERIGLEPTGEPFDAVALERDTGRPPNPMVNAGALMAGALVRGQSVDDRVSRILQVCSDAAGRELVVDEAVVEHELAHADRNRALGHLMRASGSLPCSVDDALLVLSRSCAISVTAVDLATMAASLAGWGRHPVSGAQVLPAPVVTDVLSVMATCGMYDGTGRWVHKVGMPGKSGVSGGLVSVAPGLLGLGCYSPPLDERGNSVRGTRASEAISEALGLHRFAPRT